MSLAAGMFGGLDTTPTLTLIGTGALLTFIGINIVSPAFARPVANLLGRPVQTLLRVPGRIARDKRGPQPPAHRFHGRGADDRPRLGGAHRGWWAPR